MSQSKKGKTKVSKEEVVHWKANVGYTKQELDDMDPVAFDAIVENPKNCTCRSNVDQKYSMDYYTKAAGTPVSVCNVVIMIIIVIVIIYCLLLLFVIIY